MKEESFDGDHIILESQMKAAPKPGIDGILTSYRD